MLTTALLIGSSTVSYASKPAMESNEESSSHPKVTALRSLNAYMATDMQQQVYYIPTLKELPDIKNAVSDCTDYRGNNQKFAAVYSGYFDQMCYNALTRNKDGTYTKTPAIVQSEGANSVRELTILGYDYLLSSEGIKDISTSGEIKATYSINKINSANGYIDLGTAIMDIYKAVGQEKYDIVYMFTEDPNMTVDNSPIQSEINQSLVNGSTLDTSSGKAWIFVTRTNPSLYWKQAAYDGVVWDAEALHGGQVSDKSSVKSQEISLAQFCEYAYNIMNIYGEPVMTQSEKNILLQLYGSSVPYKACTQSQVTAIENLIAKGIISPEDDSTRMNWNSSIDYEYMLTLLMRIKDVNSRKTYKDVKITMDASLISKDYYNAQLSIEPSSILNFEESKSAARVSNYYDYRISSDMFNSMLQSIKHGSVDNDLFIPTHLAFEGKDGTLFPITTQVTTLSRKVYSKDYPNIGYVASELDTAKDGQLLQFCISDGMVKSDDSKFLRLRLTAFDIPDLMHSDGKYHIYLVDDRGNKSSNRVEIKSGGGVYYSSGIRDKDESDLHTDKDKDIELSNESEINKVIETFDKKGKQAAKALADRYLIEHSEWDTDEVDAINHAASSGEYLAASTSLTYYMTIASGSEGSITVTTNKGKRISLSDILASTEDNGLHYSDPANKNDLAFVKINKTTYQVENCKNKEDLMGRITSRYVSQVETAYCKQNDELLVSSKWLISSGFIATTPTIDGDILMLATEYSNIYLDRSKKHVVVGSCVYDVSGTDTNEIWTKSGDDIYVNFRALLGWTGDFMVFKNEGGVISVRIKATNTVNGKFNNMTGSHAKDYAIRIHLMDINKGITEWMINPSEGNNVSIQGFSKSKQKSDKNFVPLSSMYPFANYFVYISDNALDTTDEFHDWLFVFKPRNIQVNGNKIDYDDKDSRKLLADHMGINLDNWGPDITVWAYPLYKDNSDHIGMPKDIKYEQEYGYICYPSSSYANQVDMLLDYMSPDYVLSTSDNPTTSLPFYIDSSGEIRCANYNTFTYMNASGNEVLMDYGDIPATILLDMDVVKKSLRNMQGKLNTFTQWVMEAHYGTGSSIPTFSKQITGVVNYKDCKVFPAVTSPALLFLNLQEYDFNTVKASSVNGAQLYWGTLRVNISKDKSGKDILKVGSQAFSDELMKQKFLLMRETGSSTTTVGKWFSVSALTAFSLNPIQDRDSSNTGITSKPVVGALLSLVDTIDWKEFTKERLLEDFEFTVAILMILALNLLPRASLAIMLLLIMLGSITNVKIWQLFCDRVFDPYRLLTAGRRDIHTFKPGITFRNSIIAMAVFSLFLDGTIIHVYEWIIEFFAIAIHLK